MDSDDSNELPQVGNPEKGNPTDDYDRVKAPVVVASLKDFGGDKPRSPYSSQRSLLTPRTPPKNTPITTHNIFQNLLSDKRIRSESESRASTSQQVKDNLAVVADNLTSIHQPNFYVEWQHEMLARKQLEKHILDLQQHVMILEGKIKIIQGNEKKEEDVAGKGDVYHTDEEELERETDWVLKSKKRPSKKRKAVESPEFVTENANTVVAPQKETTMNTGKANSAVKTNKEKQPRPPPIMISEVKTFDNVKKLISNSEDQKKCNFTSYSNNIWKINVDSSELYRSITAELNKQEVKWHTYEDKASRPIKVMARGLHPSCDEEEIIMDLKLEGFLILEAKNIIKKEKIEKENGEILLEKRGLPLFMLSFDNKESIEKIYALKSIMNIVVKIEPLRKYPSMILQCKRCQAFGHTKGYCKKDPACVKCAGNHLTKNCTIRNEEKAKCVNCREAHPASYRGCQIAVMHQQRKNKQLQTQTQKQQRNVRETEKEPVNPTQNKRIDNPKTYSNIVRNSRQEEEASIKEMLTNILKRLDNQDKLIKKLADEGKVPNPFSQQRISKNE